MEVTLQRQSILSLSIEDTEEFYNSYRSSKKVTGKIKSIARHLHEVLWSQLAVMSGRSRYAWTRRSWTEMFDQ